MDLMKAYSKVAHHCFTQKQAYQRTVMQPAPRFYITSKQAYQVVSKMIKGDFSEVDSMIPTRKRMYYEIFDRTMEAIQKRGYSGKSLHHIMPYIVIQPAPEFYMTYRGFEKIFQFMKHGRLDATPKWSEWKQHYDPNKPKPKYDFRKGIRIC